MRRMPTLTIVALLCLAPFARAAEPAEHARIEALLGRVAASGVVFVRNDTAHSAQEAAAHLRMKWERAGDRVVTAEVFIEKIGSRSSMSGKPYLVVLPGGRTLESGPWLSGLLREIDARAAKSP